MVQYANYAGLLTSLPTVEEVLDDHASELGHDLIAYRNHVYRVVNLCVAIVGDSRVELEKIAVAGVFHDLGIWTNNTFDYIAPSVAIARKHLAARGRIISARTLDRRVARVTKVRPSAHVIAAVATTWPNAGFHRRLVQLAIDQFWKHPLNPLPMVKW